MRFPQQHPIVCYNFECFVALNRGNYTVLMWMLEIFSLNQNEMEMFFFTLFTQVKFREAILHWKTDLQLSFEFRSIPFLLLFLQSCAEKNSGRRCIKDRLTWSHKIPLCSALWSRSSLLLCCSTITESICQWTTKNYCSKDTRLTFITPCPRGSTAISIPRDRRRKRVHQMDRIWQRNRHFSLVTVVPDIFRRKRTVIISTL